MAQASNETCKSLYVGNLDPRVTDEMLSQIFSVVAPVDNVKIIQDRNFTHGGLNYGFVEFSEHQAADQALQSMTGRTVFGQEIRVNWATQGSNQKEDTSNHFHIFVGDLSAEVNDEVLSKAFRPFKTMSEARVMWDQTTGKSRGFGFVAFRDKTDAEQAIATMNGEWLGSRAIRCNWANQKNNTSNNTQQGYPSVIAPNMTYEQIFAQTPPYQTTVYIGNLPHGITQQDIAPYFQQYGYVTDIRLQTDRGFAFVKMDTHANASAAIFALQGFQIGGRPAKLSWGKDRMANNNNTPYGGDPYASYNYAAGPYAQQNWVQPTTAYDPQTMRAPAPGAGTGHEGWEQYYQHQQYYNAGQNMNL
ncbi:uncharacterized protein BYT42DRAFT_565707 [Radiomyces spectabilis]|uniref:uncharacterized protein n=1 Tax=Radiomyces spectabilis TaxID=64574 RepID=UPI00221F4CD8|nr:uncharacterized protein BYT42DRAFT_565707 [Radiomyces spectabilis]KAI8381216.1 hypothetical protein BYT42DRAFT_565707 [Radiomyces spectabilis]